MEALTITDVGVAGVFVIMVLREARQIIDARRNGAAPRDGDTGPQVRGKVHEMHRVIMREVDGVPMVYRHPDIVDELKAIAANTNQANEHLLAIRNGGG